MPSTRLLRRILMAVIALAVGVVAFSARTPAEGLPIDALAQQEYTSVSAPVDLPTSVQAALAREIRQDTLHIAAVGADFNGTDVVSDPSLPFYRLAHSAVGDRYAVIQLEEGGLSPMLRLYVFQRGFWRSHLLWAGSGGWDIGSDAAFLDAIRTGALWSTGGASSSS